MQMWDVKAAVAHLNQHARAHSTGHCAQFVRQAVEAGGVRLIHHASAKDYGKSLESAQFKALPGGTDRFLAGDVVVIQPIPGHPHGHMAMYNSAIWISDFKQMHGLYPGASYRKLKPSYTVYRNAFVVYPNIISYFESFIDVRFRSAR